MKGFCTLDVICVYKLVAEIYSVLLTVIWSTMMYKGNAIELDGKILRLSPRSAMH